MLFIQNRCQMGSRQYRNLLRTAFLVQKVLEFGLLSHGEALLHHFHLHQLAQLFQEGRPDVLRTRSMFEMLVS